MVSITLRDIGALPGDEKRSLETLLQHPIEHGQQLFIMMFCPGVAPDEQTQRRAHQDLEHTLEVAQEHALMQGVTTEEADAAVDDAMRKIRPHTPIPVARECTDHPASYGSFPTNRSPRSAG